MYFTTGGAATNAATTFARQNFKTAAIFRTGNDLSGAAIKEEMEKEKIDCSFAQTDATLKTAYSVILEETGGERTILNYRGANINLNPNEIPWNNIKTKWFYLTSISGNLDFLKNAAENKRKNNSFIAWNPGTDDLKKGLSALLPLLNHIDVFFVNQEEAAELLNISFVNLKEIFKKFDEVINGIAVITMGPDGALASDGKNIFRAGVFQEEKIIDRTGAGDAFGSGFTAGLARKNYNAENSNRETVKYAFTLASANATSKVEHIGAKFGLLTKEQFENSERFKNLDIEITPA